MSREIMQQALDALEYHTMQTRPISHTDKAIEALRQALAQPEQEPYFCKDCGKGLLGKDHIHTCSPQVKREWVGLTSEDWENTPDTGKQGCERDVEMFDWIEKTLKDKNT